MRSLNSVLGLLLILHALWLGLPGGAAPGDDDARVWPVIVIGAGLAGLAAGDALRRAGTEALILEARDRIGGRVLSVNLGENLPVDLGASWIHGHAGNPIDELARRWKLATFTSDYANARTYGADGRPFTEARYAWSDSFESSFYALAGQPDLRQAPVSRLAEVFAAEHGLDAAGRRYLDFLVNISFEHDYAADAEDLSARAFDIENLPGDDRMLTGGFGQIVSRLAARQPIALNQAVTEVNYQADEVRLRTADGKVYRARRVIVTVPLGVLKAGKIRFLPPLPARQTQAIARLGVGLLDKLWLRFERVFWEPQRELIYHVSAQPDQWAEIYNLSPMLKQPVLVMLNTGRFARELEGLSDAETVEQAMAVLRRIYGPGIPNPSASLVTRWQQQPWSLGAYSYLAVGAGLNDYRNLATPVADRLFFAGEATHVKYPATTHGAYLSGQRAAAEVLKSLSQAESKH